MMEKLFWIALAGGGGTVARYALAGLVQRWGGAAFPWGTLAVNALGCFFCGLVWAAAAEHLPVSGEARAAIMVGFIGAFTTFSTFVGETGHLLAASEWLLAGMNVAAQVLLGLVLFFAGLAIGHAL